jgi:hypothetical protein
MLQEEGSRGLRGEGMAGALGVVADEPIGKLAVEEGSMKNRSSWSSTKESWSVRLKLSAWAFLFVILG